MFTHIKHRSRSSSWKASITITDSCFGIYSFEPPILKGDIWGIYLFTVFKVYTERKLNPANAMRRCLRWMYQHHGVDLKFVVDCALLESEKYPSVNFKRYLPILHRVYIPMIWSES